MDKKYLSVAVLTVLLTFIIVCAESPSDIGAKWTAKAIITPRCWLQSKQYSQHLEERLSNDLDSCEFESVGRFHATIGGVKYWVENHPYASFTYCGVRPKRSTILRAYSRMNKDRLSRIKYQTK